jgi:hypothetical protein
MGLFDWLKGKSKQGSGTQWKSGDRVLARWRDSFFYPGRVRAVRSDACEIQFDDGDVDWVASAHVVEPDVKVGSRIFARVQGGPQFAPGVVSQLKGETIQVRYDHGDEEWTNLSMVRVERDGGTARVPAPPPAKPGLDLGAPIAEGHWRSGDRVLARWLDFFWYPGTILDLGSKGYHILYDDGDQRVVKEIALMPLAIEEGEQLQIRPKNQPDRIYAPATVIQVHGETLDVEYEDGTRETNTKVSRARLWRCPVRVRDFPFEEGERVLGLDVDEYVYPAEIVSVHDDRVIVQFLDGPERMLTPELIRRFELREGLRVECRWKGGPNYFPGVLTQLDGERASIRYDDGDQEWTSIRLLRLRLPGEPEA